MIRVLIAVSEPVTRIGLTAVLEGAADLEVVPAADAPGDLRSAVAEHTPDVLFLDVSLRRADPKLLPDLLEAHPELKVLVHVPHSPADCTLRHLLELGTRARLSPEALARLDDCCLTSLRKHAHGCIGTGTEPEIIREAVRTVAAGEIAAAPWLATLARVVGAPQGEGSAPKPISARELEVMTLLAEGLSNRQIAERMDVHEQTVKNHVTRLMEKLGVENRLEVGLFAARHGMRLAQD